MQTPLNIFYIVIFVSVIGSIFCILSLFITHVLHYTLPLWFLLCGMAFFCIPILSYDVLLVSPEKQNWLQGFYIACKIWISGCGILLFYHTIRFILAKQALKHYRLCRNARLIKICSHCANIIGLKKIPMLYYGTLDSPICVTGVIQPSIIINQTVIEKLTDSELSAVFAHELTHIKRKHLLYENIYRYVCVANWLNPFVWIAKADFSLHCEIDCDSATLKLLQGKIPKVEYASSIIRLLELSTHKTPPSNMGIGALNFILAKRRIQKIATPRSKFNTQIATVVLVICFVLIVIWSLQLSREYFYPYPAYQTETEYREGYNE